MKINKFCRKKAIPCHHLLKSDSEGLGVAPVVMVILSVVVKLVGIRGASVVPPPPPPMTAICTHINYIIQ